MPRPSHCPSLDNPNNTWQEMQIIPLPRVQFLPQSCWLCLLKSKHFLSTVFSDILSLWAYFGVRVGAVGWRTVLQAGRSRFRPMGSSGFHRLNSSSCTTAQWVDPASNRNEYHGYLLGGKGGPCVGLTILPCSWADCLEILGTSTSWSPKGPSRPV
jgi:hypothetical protein